MWLCAYISWFFFPNFLFVGYWKMKYLRIALKLSTRRFICEITLAEIWAGLDLNCSAYPYACCVHTYICTYRIVKQKYNTKHAYCMSNIETFYMHTFVYLCVCVSVCLCFCRLSECSCIQYYFYEVLLHCRYVFISVRLWGWLNCKQTNEKIKKKNYSGYFNFVHKRFFFCFFCFFSGFLFR